MATERRSLFMARKLACSLLLLSTLMVCQSQNQKPSITSAQATPKSGAQEEQPEQPEQPIQALLQEKSAANTQIQSNLQSALDDDLILSGANVGAKVDDKNITLTGAVQSYRQHQRVLQLVSPYKRARKIVNKMSVQ
jgi:osmotically-inducible protein OsmY